MCVRVVVNLSGWMDVWLKLKLINWKSWHQSTTGVLFCIIFFFPIVVISSYWAFYWRSEFEITRCSDVF